MFQYSKLIFLSEKIDRPTLKAIVKRKDQPSNLVLVSEQRAYWKIYRNYPFMENLLTGQLRGEACVLHYEISRQKRIPN